MPTPQYSASRPGSRGPPHDEWAEVHGRDQSQPCVGRGESVGRTRRTVPVPERREDAPTRGPDTARPRALRRTRSLPANCPGWLRTLHLRQPRPRPAPLHRQPTEPTTQRRIPRRHAGARGIPSSGTRHPIRRLFEPFHLVGEVWKLRRAGGRSRKLPRRRSAVRRSTSDRSRSQTARFVPHAVEQLWSRAVAAGRNPRQNDALGKPQK